MSMTEKKNPNEDYLARQRQAEAEVEEYLRTGDPSALNATITVYLSERELHLVDVALSSAMDACRGSETGDEYRDALRAIRRQAAIQGVQS